MSNLSKRGSFFKFYSWLPLVVLYVSVLNEFDFNYLNLDYFSFNFPFILICIATSYFRNITIRPNPIKDWFYFLFVVSLINSINYSILTLFFSFNLVLMSYLVNTFFTFLFYIIFVSIFKFYLKTLND